MEAALHREASLAQLAGLATCEWSHQSAAATTTTTTNTTLEYLSRRWPLIASSCPAAFLTQGLVRACGSCEDRALPHQLSRDTRGGKGDYLCE
ncbi:hypothetical protein E2C01_019959 [Portunus trituberculatus]|uniref:Uncharacterized protein n=1 Tax=Portunus trituberculatus TaxID=210409 RepID=A0A5B7E079_PORTR|nr:hypothetical protein [Portunus trituberculatus]